jgi:hypothetical protein
LMGREALWLKRTGDIGDVEGADGEPWMRKGKEAAVMRGTGLCGGVGRGGMGLRRREQAETL